MSQDLETLISTKSCTKPSKEGIPLPACWVCRGYMTEFLLKGWRERERDRKEQPCKLNNPIFTVFAGTVP